jgi:hypothetical protein
MLILPIALALLASGLRKYPFHGRIILFLVPALLLLIANGLDGVAARLDRRRIFPILATLLLIYPCLSTSYGVATTHLRDFTSHGDVRIDIFCSTPDNDPEKFFPKTAPRRGTGNESGRNAPRSPKAPVPSAR